MTKQSRAVRPPSAARLNSFLDAFLGILERRSLLALVLFNVACFVAILSQAVSRKLWFDELFTFHITRMPTWAQRIDATAADAQPPLTYLFTGFFHSILGPTEIATRLPEAIGFLVFSVCLYVVVRGRMGLVWGFIALLAPSLTYAFRYSFEARPYGLLLGFAGLALVGWVWATESDRRTAGVALLTFALAGAVGSHHYGLFQVILPIAAGEAARTVIRRRIDWAILLAGIIGLSPFLFTYPLAKASSELLFQAVQQSTNFFARPTWGSIPAFYKWLLMLPFSPLLIALAVALLYGWRSGARREWRAGQAPGLTIPMWTASWTFLALPFLIVPFTMFSTGYFMTRYCLAAVAGVVLLLCGFAAKRLGERGGAVMLLTMLAGAAVAFPLLVRPALHLDRSTWPFQPPSMTRADQAPILISDPILYLREATYAREAEKARLTFLTNVEAALKTSDFVPELSLTSGAAWLPGNVVDYDAFLGAHDKFWVLSNFQSDSQWHIAKLTADGWRLDLRGREGPFDVYWAHAPR